MPVQVLVLRRIKYPPFLGSHVFALCCSPVWKMHEADEALCFATPSNLIASVLGWATGLAKERTGALGPDLLQPRPCCLYLHCVYRLPKPYAYGKRNSPNRFLLCHFVDVKTFQRASETSWRCQWSWLRMSFVWIRGSEAIELHQVPLLEVRRKAESGLDTQLFAFHGRFCITRSDAFGCGWIWWLLPI